MDKQTSGIPFPMPSDAELLKAYLADRDVPCPGCGYSLKGCVSHRCPECASEMTLQLAAPPRMLRWTWLVRAALLSIVLEGGWLIRSAVRWFWSQGWTFGSSSRFVNFASWLYYGCGMLAFPLGIWLLVRTFGPRTASRSVRIEKAALGALALLVLVHGISNLVSTFGWFVGWY
jgi:hypothetical protein